MDIWNNLVITRGKEGCGQDEESKEDLIYGHRGDCTLGGENIMEYTDDIFWNLHVIKQCYPNKYDFKKIFKIYL